MACGSWCTMDGGDGGATGFRWLAVASAAVVSIAPVAATGQDARPLPPEVRTYFDSARQECVKAGDMLHVADERGYVQTADFNGDGHPDYIVEYASLLCPALGASEYCGSAGCTIAILVSQGDRLREVYSDNLQGYAITKPLNGKQNLVFAAHGTYCGHKTGADTCFGTMSWTPKGFRTTYSATEPLALRQANAAVTAQPGDGRPDKDARLVWKAITPAAGKKGASIAMSDGSPDGMKTVVACAENLPVLVLSFPAGAKAPPPVGQHIMVELGESRPGEPHADVVLQPVQDKTVYLGPLSRAALSIMQATARQDYAMLPAAWRTRERDYWIDMPALPLRNFDQASKAVLGSCAARAR